MEAAERPHFGALLRQFRLDAGMTQQELAERAKLSVEAVSTLERGARTHPYRETVVLLGRALDLSPEREALLISSARKARPPRRHREGVDASLLRLVRPNTQATPNHNLPQQLTSFVGRQTEIAEVAALLREHRLVTIIGAGGVGKTRVAGQTASDILDDNPDGVWLIDLAPLADQTLVASAALSALRLPSTTGSPIDVVVAYLKTRRLVLILDNCEHVIAQARDVAARIVQSCAGVHILSTSREALGVPGERVYRLPSLAVPPDSSRTAQSALRYGAVGLFVDRALAVDPAFALTDDNAPDVTEICRRLDGIPLAIELAAARVKVLAPCQIAERLEQRFRLLTGGDPRALPRHQTMTALFDWSYDLLTPREQRFFVSLSVFAGGCTLDAASAVCTTESEDDLDVVDLLTSLVTKSLLVAELAGREERYRLLESSRRYAWEKLVARGEQSHVVRRHALAYVRLSEQLDREWDTTPDREWLPQAQVELENWRAVMEWAIAKRSDVTLGQRLAASRNVVWRSFPLPEARSWVRAALELVDERTPPALVARLEHSEAEGAGYFAERGASLATANRALARYRELGDVLGTAQVQTLAAASLVIFDRFAEAEPLLREALATARTLGDRRLVAYILLTTGNGRSRVGDFVVARAYLTEALALAKLIGAELLAASAASSLASNEYDAGNPEAAVRLGADALAAYRALSSPGTTQYVAANLASMAVFLIALRRYAEARVAANEALAIARGLGYDVMVAISQLCLAIVATLRLRAERRLASALGAAAARVFGFVGARLTTLQVPKAYCAPDEYDRALAVLGDALGADELARLTAVGAAMTEDEAVAEAYALD